MNAKALVVFLLVAIAGIAGFFVLRSGVDADPAPVHAGQPAAPGAAAAGGTAERATAALAPAAAASAGDGAAGRIAAPAVADGGVAEVAHLRGRLVDRNGAGRAGVVLSLRTWEGFDGIDLVDLPPVPRRGGEPQDRPTWTTGGDGAFRIPLAKDRSGTLELVTADMVFAGGEPTANGKKGDQDLGDVTVLQAGRMLGVVQDERGQPVAGVKVAATLGSLGFGTVSSATTKADGTFSVGMLRPGKWSLRTASGKFLPTVLELELAPEERKEGIVLVVKPGRAIAGQVVDDRGVGVAGMKVGSKRKEARGAVDIERFSADEATTTDAHGYFTLSGLADEIATVRAFGPGHSPATAADVQVGTGNLVLRVDRLGVVEGVLVGLDGTPIAGSRVRAQEAAVPGDGLMVVDELDFDGPGGRAATTGADGSFRLDTVRPGNVSIVASGKSHRPVRQAGVDVLPAQTTKGIRLVADPGATARVKVVDQAGKPVAGARVRAQRAEDLALGGGGQFRARAVSIEDRDGEVRIGGDERLGEATSDAEGLATIAGLPAATLSFTATHDEFAAAVPARVAVPKSGTVEAALTMRKPGQAEILALGVGGDPAVGVELQINGEGDAAGEPRKVTSGEQGLARVASLAPGNYTVAFTRSPEGARLGDAMVFVAGGGETIAASAQKFTIVAGETTRVEVRQPVLTRLHGIVTGADGPATGCAVELTREDGDNPDIPGFGGRNTVAGADGAFAFDGVEPGLYSLRFGKPDQVVKARQEVAVPANTPELRQDLQLRTGRLKVQIVAAGSGEAVEKAEVELVRADAADAAAVAGGPPRRARMVMVATLTNDGGGSPETTTMTVGNQRAHTDENGIAEIDDVPTGDYTLRVKHRKHAPSEKKGVTVVERQTTDCGRVELGAAGLIRGKVAGADGKPARMALVTYRAADSAEWSEPQMSQAGNFRIQGLAAGKYRVRGQAIGPTPSGYSPEVEVEVKPGETATADLQLPAN